MDENNAESIISEEEAFDDSGWDEEETGYVQEADEEPESGDADEAEPEADSDGGENQPAQPEAEAEAQKAEPEQNDSFELNYMGEKSTVGRNEVVALAQKGMDYDRIRQERDGMSEELKELRGNKEKLAEYEGFLDKLARSAGIDIPTLIDNTLAKALVAEEAKKGNTITEEFAMQRIKFDREKAAFEKQKQGGGEQPKKQDEKPKEEPAKEETGDTVTKAKRDDEANAFLAAYPDIDPKTIPKDVLEAWTKGTPLLQAYMAYENKKLKADIEALKQNTKNSERSTGSAKSAGAGRPQDPAFIGWDD